MITIDYNDRDVLQALQDLQLKTDDLRPALREIGEVLVASTKRRFVTTMDPDGNKWLLNSVLSTLEHKEGDRPLTDEGILGSQIFYNLIGNDTLEVGSSMEYAAMQQFGGSQAEFPWLWGDIPARPFLGVSDVDREEILTILQDYLAES